MLILTVLMLTALMLTASVRQQLVWLTLLLVCVWSAEGKVAASISTKVKTDQIYNTNHQLGEVYGISVTRIASSNEQRKNKCRASPRSATAIEWH